MHLNYILAECGAGLGCCYEEIPCTVVKLFHHRYDGVLMEGKLTAGSADNITRIIGEIVLVVHVYL
jgi:hypothetical protein